MAPNAIEAPYVVPHGGKYYLFTSWGQCCDGVNSDYKIVVGRADSVTGPYVDQEGRALLEGGGTVLRETSGSRVGPGGQSVSEEIIAYHYYDAKAKGTPKLALQRISWGDDGWPKLDGNKRSRAIEGRGVHRARDGARSGGQVRASPRPGSRPGCRATTRWPPVAVKRTASPSASGPAPSRSISPRATNRCRNGASGSSTCWPGSSRAAYSAAYRLAIRIALSCPSRPDATGTSPRTAARRRSPAARSRG